MSAEREKESRLHSRLNEGGSLFSVPAHAVAGRDARAPGGRARPIERRYNFAFLLLTFSLVVFLDDLLILLRDEEGAGDVFVFEVGVALIRLGDCRGEQALRLSVAAR